MLQPDYPIVTERRLLLPYRENDLDALYSIRSRADVMRFLYEEPLSRDEARANMMERIGQDALRREGDELKLAMEHRDTGAMIGGVNLTWSSVIHKQGEIGFMQHPDQWGRGYAREAVLAVLRLGFEGFGLHRIYGRCDGRNAASARLMERLGMRREAHLRENEFVKGEWTDELVFAMLASEWTVCGQGLRAG
jgi:RimJ/RimL family protein N-acetyltransferase